MRNYYFNLPPLTSLTIDQRAALRETSALALIGGAGTGKSLVSMYRHLTLCENGKNSQLLTYTKTLCYYFKQCMEGKGNSTAASNVATTISWSNHARHRDEIIVDEAQDVSSNVYEDLAGYCNALSYGADDAQQLYSEKGCSTDRLQQVIRGNVRHSLNKNFRNAKEILRLAKAAFPYAHISEQEITNCSRMNGFKPDLYVTSSYSKYDKVNADRDNKIKELLSDFLAQTNHNVGILCPWQSNVDYYHNLLADFSPSRDHSYFVSDGDRSIEDGMKQLHITTFKSAKGLEFDTVIIPDFHRAFESMNPQFHVDWRDFYVGVTRARTNLILISCDAIRSISDYVNVYYI